jgi:alkanesulfonate monooxygenase SsuD/methylene tetrahydromethanopterin reductase-like flavin-dependent oxidoreductase (luciferase family)
MVGIRMPLVTGGITPQDFAEIARTAAELGFGSIWAGDHVVPPTAARDPYPYTDDHGPPAASDSPWLDPFLALTWIGAHTDTRIRIGTSVYLLPLRNVTLAAKQIASLSFLTGRGISLGVGSGWFRTEYDIIGAPFDGRATRVQKQLVELRELLRTGEFPGDWVDSPAPMRPLCIEPTEFLWGGYSPLAMKIIARHCDGWLPTKCSWAELESHRDLLRRTCDDQARDFAELRLVIKPGPGPEPGDERIDERALERYVQLCFDEVILELPLNPTSAGECLKILADVAGRTFR